MKIAIVGAGLAGLAFSWYYKNLDPSAHLILFDSEPPSCRTSALAHLLYPYVGIRSKLNWQGPRALQKSTHLLKVASQFSDATLYKKLPLLKLASSEKQLFDLKKSVEEFPELKWKEETSLNKPGIWMEEVIQVDAQNYLIALEQACLSIGIEFQNKLFTKQMQDGFDKIIYCSGHQYSDSFSKPALSQMKGQGIILRRPAGFDQDFCLIAHQLHLIPAINPETIYIGNTFERDFKDSKPEPDKAIEILWPKLIEYFPNFSKSLILDVKAGVRLNAPSRLPILSKIQQNMWAFTALGSKGMLYHAYLGEILAQAVKKNSTKEIPKKVLYTNF
ncbi:MAG: tRNA 5-methylaminomethyl-2-thiouridine biosynthesis bifunctional protein MnmC [Chlamydiae bacterium]|nr:tRNA 5-methylaminomethyl-2-thiouridine biosynthesis bifunctional protein MnmC [Chlamydiota bacterium]